MAPKGADWDKAVERWRMLATDEGAEFDCSVRLDAGDIASNMPDFLLPFCAGLCVNVLWHE